jgi:hypothetical protein
MTERAILTSRTYRPVGNPIRWGATTAQRFGFSMRTSAVADGGLHWTTPSGWREVAPTSLRQANFVLGGDVEAQCYLTVLAGDGGGVAANVNRWREQMSLEHMTAVEVDALPRIDFFGQRALYVDLLGTWTGGGAEAADHRMLGVALVDAGAAKFLKLLGPKRVVDDQVEAFEALAASFHEDGPGAHGAGATAHTHGASAPTGNSAEGLAWQPPDGWRRGPDRSMRAVTFFVGDDDVAECYVSVLSGAAGGALANVNRWRNQMGREGIDQVQFEALPRIDMLGRRGVLTEVTGTYTGMGDEPPREGSLLGALCSLLDRSVFVKMIGPAELLDAEREAFIGFCESLEETQG